MHPAGSSKDVTIRKVPWKDWYVNVYGITSYSCPLIVVPQQLNICTVQVILADTHIAGPEYRLSGENGLLDNESITKTQVRSGVPRVGGL